MQIIAEIGSNHDGDVGRAKELVHMAAEAGADAAKFQIFRADRLVHPTLAAYPQAKGYAKQIDRFRAMEFTESQWEEVIGACEDAGIAFAATCFDVDLVRQYGPMMPFIKIASGDITYHDLIRAGVETGKPVYLSTGCATWREIEQAVELVPASQRVVMHCVSRYPTPPELADMGRIRSLMKRFYHVGYSDHTTGIQACEIAAAFGVEVIEKHFTDDPLKDWGDHPISADFADMAYLVESVKRIQVMMQPSGESPPRNMLRGAYAARKIEAGQAITRDDVVMLRPMGRDVEQIVGRRADRDYEPLEALR